MSYREEIRSPGHPSVRPPILHRDLHLPAKSRGFRMGLMMFWVRVVEKISSCRSRAASGLHIASVRDTSPTG